MSDTLAINETSRLISSDKVEGTAVYDRAGEKLGSIRNFMVGKHSGQVEYAVLEFGGFLGIGSDHYPIPWSKLDYEVDKGGYVVDIDKSQLEDAPRHPRERQPAYDEAYGRQISDYWGVGYTGL